MPKKYDSLFAQCYRNKQKTPKFFLLTRVTLGEGGRPRWKVVTLSFVFFVEPFPYILDDLWLISVVQLEGTIALADLA